MLSLLWLQHKILLFKTDPIVDYWVLYAYFFPKLEELDDKTTLLGNMRHKHEYF